MVSLRFHSPLTGEHEMTSGIGDLHVRQAGDPNVVGARIRRVEAELTAYEMHSNDQRLQPGLSRCERPYPTDNDGWVDPGRGCRDCVGITDVKRHLPR